MSNPFARIALKVVGAFTALFGAGLLGCGPGPAPAYGVQLTCTTDDNCRTTVGANWYCDNGNCRERLDGGTPDAH